jgi:alkylhydroperoxidase family enzyme
MTPPSDDLATGVDTDPSGTGAVLAAVLERHGRDDVAAALAEAHRAAWAAVDPRLLELCRLRVAQLLGCAEEAQVRTPGTGVDPAVLDAVVSWPTSPLLDDRDRAVLAWCEQFVIDVASMDDATVAAVRDHLGDAALVDLTSALLVIEQRQRLRTGWARVLDAEGDQ